MPSFFSASISRAEIHRAIFFTLFAEKTMSAFSAKVFIIAWLRLASMFGISTTFWINSSGMRIFFLFFDSAASCRQMPQAVALGA